jgi:hypothetical protein
MNCTAVRDRLSESALGVVPEREAEAIDRHVGWCAACRKEARDLQAAATVLAFAPAPASPPSELEDRVVEAVRTAVAGRVAPAIGSVRRGRTAVAVVLAAAIAVAGLWWGAVMAGRAARIEDRASLDASSIAGRFATFSDLFRSSLSNPETRVNVGTLAPRGDAAGGGAAMTIVTPGDTDHVLVILTGMPAEPAPYRIALVGGRGAPARIGALRGLDSSGAGTIARDIERSLRRFRVVVVRDAHGTIVLRGSLRPETSFATPSP